MTKIDTNDIDLESTYLGKIKRESKAYHELLGRSNSGEEFIKNIDSIFDIIHSKQLLMQIKNCFREYTDHSIKHVYSVLLTMEQLVFDIKKLTNLELAAIILSALLHDVGMFYEDEDFDDYNSNGELPTWAIERLELLDYHNLKTTNGDDYAKQYMVRLSHGQRAGFVMDKYDISRCCSNRYVNDEYYSIIKFICASHQFSYNEMINEYKAKWPGTNVANGIDLGTDYSNDGKVNVIFICLLLRIADLLDFDADRAPKNLFEKLCIQDATSRYEWKKNGLISNHAKVRQFDSLSRKCPCCSANINKEIYFTAKSLPDHRDSNELEEYFSALRGVKQYINYVEEEIVAIVDCYNRNCFNKDYILYLYPKVTFEAKDVPDAKINFNYNTIVKMLLTESIYGEKRIGLREIIQNAMDACKFRFAFESESYNPIIKIIFNYDENKFIIEDNGRGMTTDIIQQCFLKIGGSIYNTDEYKFSKYKFDHAGHFGIGFFATFMLSNKEVIIETSYMNTRDKAVVKVSSQSEFYYLGHQALKVSERAGFTRIIIDLKDVKEVFSFKSSTNTIDGEDSIISYIENNFLSNIGEGNKIVFKHINIKNGEATEKLMNVQMLTNNMVNQYDLGHYLEDTQLQIEYLTNIQDSIKWKMKWFCYDYSMQQFMPCDAQEIHRYKEIYYLRIDVDDGEQLYLFLPFDNDSTDKRAFEYDIHNSQRLVSDESERICPGIKGIAITFGDFGPTANLFKSNSSFVCLRGCFLVYQFGNNKVFINTQQRFEDELPTIKAIKSGVDRCDNVYIRNIKIPQAPLTIPYMIVGINDTSFQFPHKVTVNINKRGIIPKTNRNELDENLLSALSYAVGYAYMKFLLEKYFESDQNITKVKKIVENFYPTYSSSKISNVSECDEIENLKYIFIKKEKEK